MEHPEREITATPWFKNYEEGVPFSLTYPRVPLTNFLQEAAESFPQNVALIFAGRKYSYRELQEHVNSLAIVLSALGIQKSAGNHPVSRSPA